MSPPTEQLIRDYLNRISVAARGRLSAEERRALVARTHDFIERNASPSGPATSIQLAALLARLGDPGALVDQEVARLAAVRGETPAAAALRPGALAARLLRRSVNWPDVAGNPDLQQQLLNTGLASPSVNGTAYGAQPGSPGAQVPRQAGPADRAVAGDAAPRPATGPDATGPGPRWPASSAASASAGPAGPNGTAAGYAAAPEASAGEDPSPEPQAGEPEAEQPVAPRDASLRTEDLPEGLTRTAALAVWARSLPARALGRSRRNPLEATAIILLGLGGVIYPPVWLFGACLALASGVWDYRDKWVGIAGPVLLLVLGTVAGLALGSSYHRFGDYLHEAWVYLNVLSRVGAAAGTWFLAWRLTHARRVPDVPPWNRPRRFD